MCFSPLLFTVTVKSKYFISHIWLTEYEAVIWLLVFGTIVVCSIKCRIVSVDKMPLAVMPVNLLTTVGRKSRSILMYRLMSTQWFCVQLFVSSWCKFWMLLCFLFIHLELQGRLIELFGTLTCYCDKFKISICVFINGCNCSGY